MLKVVNNEIAYCNYFELKKKNHIYNLGRICNSDPLSNMKIIHTRQKVIASSFQTKKKTTPKSELQNEWPISSVGSDILHQI